MNIDSFDFGDVSGEENRDWAGLTEPGSQPDSPADNLLMHLSLIHI